MAILAQSCAAPAPPPPPVSVAGCAAALPPLAHHIYDVAAPDMRPDTDLRTLLRDKIIPMVMMGETTADRARIAARLAAPCLDALRDAPH